MNYHLSSSTKRNNKYINNNDPKKLSTFITYLDMNNLYGWAVSKYLPYEEFEWLENLISLMRCQIVNVIL